MDRPGSGTSVQLNLAREPRAGWFEYARCREYDPDMFFPDKGESPNPAKRICLRCPVRVECLNYALRARVPYGVWGGLSDRERRRLLIMAS